MAGFPQELLANWRGDATLTPGSSPANAFDSAFPRSVWNGFDLPRVWRRGNRNAVASVLIEKPSRGNWLPLVDCGFDLQYTPLLEHQEAGQRILFCQMDLSGRTENDPAAAALLRRIADYIQRAPAPAPGRTLYYAGNDAGVELLTRLGVAVNRQLPPAAEPEETLLVLGPEATRRSAPPDQRRLAGSRAGRGQPNSRRTGHERRGSRGCDSVLRTGSVEDAGCCGDLSR